jgi:hypothetical protein
MRPQTRPFMVETKTRNRARQPAIFASFTRQDDWLDLIPPDDLPVRDVNEDLTVAPAHAAFRAAERIFARVGGGTQAAQPSDSHPAPATIAEPARRVLPDLLAAAREQERACIQQPPRNRPALSTPIRRRPRQADHRLASPSVPTVEVKPKASPIEVPSGHAGAAIALSRRNPGRSKLPPGQGWKERRLPKVCWARKLPRT